MNEILLARGRDGWSGTAFLKKALWSAAGSCALGGLYAWNFEEHWLRIEQRDMPLPDLGSGLEGATLAQISDLHCSPIVLERYLRQCVQKINELGVDFVAITGDFITGPKHYARRVARVLRELSPRVATVACLGNHDYGIFHPRGLGAMRGLSYYVAEHLSHADVFVMLNESRVFTRDGSAIQFVGVEDYWSGAYDLPAAFDMAYDHLPTIALCHNPDPAVQIASYGADWILSGHTHGSGMPDGKIGGMVLPTANKHFAAGEYQLAEGKYLYVNRGLSYARRMNLNARPEITLFTFRKAEGITKQAQSAGAA